LLLCATFCRIDKFLEISKEMCMPHFTGKAILQKYFTKEKQNSILTHLVTDLVNAKRNFNDALTRKKILYLLDGVLDLIQDLHKKTECN
jgi:hypothetical protein